MKFNTEVWLKYRAKANDIGSIISSYKNINTGLFEGIGRTDLTNLIDAVTEVLKMSDDYLTSCYMMPKRRGKHAAY